MMDAGSLRARARAIFEAGLAAADPAAAVTRAVQDMTPPTRLIAVGKAARRMAQAALDVLGPVPALVVTNDENAGDVPGATVLVSGHPVPDARGEAAARAVEAAVAGLSAGDTVLCLISGGGSALLPAPAPGLTLADKQEVSRLLLASGADIADLNLVRQQLSRLKGGGLLRAAAPAGVTALILSDVVGDDLRVIASGPTVAPIGTRAQAAARLRALGLWDRLPAAVARHLSAPAPDLPPLPVAENRLIGSNALSLAAMAAAAPGATVHPVLDGDVAAAAGRVAACGPGVHLFGGETTVRLTGHGRGGRNQELALRLALLARKWPAPWVFLSGGTDGRDGPTDAAGGIVDHGTLSRMAAAGIDPAARLADNDSHPALAASGDLLVTGGTGTNVADLQVLIRG
jgi:hydroxypyruvate reductase